MFDYLFTRYFLAAMSQLTYGIQYGEEITGYELDIIIFLTYAKNEYFCHHFVPQRARAPRNLVKMEESALKQETTRAVANMPLDIPEKIVKKVHTGIQIVNYV